MPNTSTGVNCSNTILVGAIENPQLKKARISLPTAASRRTYRGGARRWRTSSMTSFSRDASHQDETKAKSGCRGRSTRSNRDCPELAASYVDQHDVTVGIEPCVGSQLAGADFELQLHF
jgi:hypothetical protein